MGSNYGICSARLSSATLLAVIVVLGGCTSSAPNSETVAEAACTERELVRVFDMAFSGEPDVVFRLLGDGRIFRVEPDGQRDHVAIRINPRNEELEFMFESGGFMFMSGEVAFFGVTSDGNVWRLDESDRPQGRPVGSGNWGCA